MNPIDLWKLSNELTVTQAALLIIGLDPSEYEHIDTWGLQNQPAGYHAVQSALKNAVRAKSIRTFVFTKPNQVGTDEVCEPVYDGEIEDWELTVIPVDEIRGWLVNKNFKDGFFIEQKCDEDDFMDSKNSHYAPKLAAAVSAWRAVNDDIALLEGKTPKQAVEKYLRENASRFGLTKDDGLPNQTGITEICKITNWNPGGGVAKTRTQVFENPPTPLNVVKTGGSKSSCGKEVPF